MDYENRVTLCGALSAAPRRTETPSGAVRWLLEVDTGPECGGPVPVVWLGAVDPAWVAGTELSVVGSVRRRYFRAGGVTQSRVEVAAELIGSRERGQVNDDEVCGQCSGTGWLFDQGYSDAPAGWVPVQRCDTCQRWADDEDAAIGAALAHGGVPVEFFQEGPDEDGNETDPGDWCIMPGGIHQACAVCDLDIEHAGGVRWVDRGNSSECGVSIPASFHAPRAWQS